MISRKATIKDLPELLLLQKQAFASEAELYHNAQIQPLTQTLPELQEEFSQREKLFLVVEDDDEVIASVRTVKKGDTCFIQKLVVHPDYQNNGIGKMLMNEVEEMYPEVDKFELFTGEKSVRNIKFYEKLGYSISGKKNYLDDIHKVIMEKYNHSKILK